MFYELEGIARAGGLYGRHRPAQSRQLASRIRSGPPFMARHAAPREVSQRIGSTSERCAPCCDGRPDGRRCRSGYSRRCRPIRRTAAGWALRQRTLSPIWRDFGGQGGPRRLAAAQIRMIGARSAVREVYTMPASNRRSGSGPACNRVTVSYQASSALSARAGSPGAGSWRYMFTNT